MIARLKLPFALQWCPKCGEPRLEPDTDTEFTPAFNRIEYAVKLRCVNGHEGVIYLTIDAIREAYSRDIII